MIQNQISAAADTFDGAPPHDRGRLLANLVSLAPTGHLRALWNSLNRTEELFTGPLAARVLGKLSEGDDEAKAGLELIALVASPAEDTSKQAAVRLGEAATNGWEWLRPELFAGYADDRRASVRLRMLETLTVLMRQHGKSDETTTLRWLAVSRERLGGGTPVAPAETSAVLGLAHALLRDGRCRGHDLLSHVEGLIADLMLDIPDNQTVQKALLALVKTIVISYPDDEFCARIGTSFVEFVGRYDLASTADARAFGEQILGRLVERGFAETAGLIGPAVQWPASNQMALASVVLRHSPEREHSPLLDQMLELMPNQEVQRHIWTLRLAEGGPPSATAPDPAP
ncbi:hypothetical protein JS756_24350 [Streptomyces actuosus]|uniref:HEAT repeat domain-containing protein n=1 Tax=Streptomyces actuosus TaxID=1885 RepID=A0ABS2VVZ6_STRAS|nr:hypothetical protein [Streptomyces actuosus]MBN0047180.1 hypothetical protein [Streptomyces actuosus]